MCNHYKEFPFFFFFFILLLQLSTTGYQSTYIKYDFNFKVLVNMEASFKKINFGFYSLISIFIGVLLMCTYYFFV